MDLRKIQILSSNSTEAPKISNFSSLAKDIYKRFSILSRTYFRVLESFWVDLVVQRVCPVKIRQYFKNGQNWPISRIGPTLAPEIRIFFFPEFVIWTDLDPKKPKFFEF